MLKEASAQAIASFEVPKDHDTYYAELTRRNQAFISPAAQKKLRSFKILVAGCGSTGGACIESLARFGVEHFALTDNGSYELNNLNRQHANLDELGKNKAVFHGEQVLKINPFSEVIVRPEGITRENAKELVQWADLIMDGVDVTTNSGIAMKIVMHEQAKRFRKPTLAALDVGFCQWGRSYDYRNPNLDVLDGKAKAASQTSNPIKALFTLVPMGIVPPHCVKHLWDLLHNPDMSASQLGCTSDLLSAIIVPSVLRFVEYGELVPGWDINLQSLAFPLSVRLKQAAEAVILRRKIKKMFDL
jgi:hypothetical protein